MIILKKIISNHGDNILRIKQVRTKDAGVYTCRAYNQAGSVKSTANLVVKSMLKGSNNSKPISSIVKK
jgi:hypothetical protein